MNRFSGKTAVSILSESLQLPPNNEFVTEEYLSILIRYTKKYYFQFVEPAKQAIWERENLAQSRHATYQAGFVQLILMVARTKC